ncbi:MAG: hypothetical protein GX760_04285 [Erysipelothrix sp.]|nr:hypothetical protein [Erysipelothrix sp.]
MSKKESFDIKRKGYDRFAVDAYVSRVNQEKEFSHAKLNVYRKQLDFLSEQLELKQNQNIQLLNEIKNVNDVIEQHQLNNDTRNKLITEAQMAADKIILESLQIAKEVLDTVNMTSYNTSEYKQELLAVIDRVRNSVSEIEIMKPIEVDLDLER